MKRLRLLVTVLGLSAMLLADCNGSPPPITPGTSATAGRTATLKARQFNLLVATDGAVRLKREDWNDYVPVFAGTLLNPTDLLAVAANGSATVLCAGPAVKTATALGSVPCPVERGWFEYDGARFRSIRATLPISIPYIVYPRNTLVLTAHPVLRWNDTKVNSYTVAVEANGKTVWSQSGVVTNTVRYPDNAPPLRPGTDYLLVVQDDLGHTSLEDPEKGLGFRVLSDAKRAEVEQQRQAIMALASLDETARTLALAVYYATWSGEEGKGLWGEAWPLLAQVAQTQDRPAIHLWMGDMLRIMKLPNEAKSAYETARDQAKCLGDRESQAAAWANLWRITRETAQLDSAIKLYQDLGDLTQVDVLREESKPKP